MSQPGFPPFAEWAKMTEDEQDALLARLEAGRRRKSWFAIGTATAAVLLGIATAIYSLLPT
jgi:hypothetical protein